MRDEGSHQYGCWQTHFHKADYSFIPMHSTDWGQFVHAGVKKKKLDFLSKTYAWSNSFLKSAFTDSIDMRFVQTPGYLWLKSNTEGLRLEGYWEATWLLSLVMLKRPCRTTVSHYHFKNMFQSTFMCSLRDTQVLKAWWDLLIFLPPHQNCCASKHSIDLHNYRTKKG